MRAVVHNESIEELNAAIREPIGLEIVVYDFSGGYKVYTKTDITNIKYSDFCDDTGLTLPYRELTVSLSNLDGRFDIDNPNGEYHRFSEGVAVAFDVFLKQFTALEEQFRMGVFYIKDVPTLDNQSFTFTAIDSLQYNSNIYEQTCFDGTVEDAMDEYNAASGTAVPLQITEYPKISVGVSQFYLHRLPFNQCLQLYAMATMQYLRISTDGLGLGCYYWRRFGNRKYAETVSKDYYLDNYSIVNKLNSSIKATPSSIKVSGNVLQAKSGVNPPTVVYQSDMSIKGTKKVICDHAPIVYSKATAAVAGDNANIVYTDFGTEQSVITVMGDGNISLTITAPKLSATPYSYEYQVTGTGDVCEVRNEALACFPSHVEDVSSWLSDILSIPNNYECDFIQDYRLEAGDCIFIQTPYAEFVPVRIIKLTFEFPGIVGHIQMKRVNSKIVNIPAPPNTKYWITNDNKKMRTASGKSYIFVTRKEN